MPTCFWDDDFNGLSREHENKFNSLVINNWEERVGCTWDERGDRNVKKSFEIGKTTPRKLS